MSKIVFLGDSITAYIPYILNEVYSDDGVHLNNKGYNIVLNEILNYIKENIKTKEKTV